MTTDYEKWGITKQPCGPRVMRVKFEANRILQSPDEWAYAGGGFWHWADLLHVIQVCSWLSPKTEPEDTTDLFWRTLDMLEDYLEDYEDRPNMTVLIHLKTGLMPVTVDSTGMAMCAIKNVVDKGSYVGDISHTVFVPAGAARIVIDELWQTFTGVCWHEKTETGQTKIMCGRECGNSPAPGRLAHDCGIFNYVECARCGETVSSDLKRHHEAQARWWGSRRDASECPHDIDNLVYREGWHCTECGSYLGKHYI